MQVSSTEQVVLSANGEAAKLFQLISTDSGVVRLSDPDRTQWYVHPRSHYMYLYVDPEELYATNLPVFQSESSFILHPDTFYPGYHAFESINFPNYYIKSDYYYGRLWIEQRRGSEDVTYNQSASFKLSGLDTSCKYSVNDFCILSDD